MENKIAKLEQRVEQLEKILRMHNNLLYEVIEHIELETISYYSGDPHNNSDGKYHKALRESQKVLEERIYSNYETKKIINDIKEWFKKNESFFEDEPLTYWVDGYIIKGCDISKELAPYSLMVYPVDDSPTLADNRWEFCCEVHPYNEMGNLEYDKPIVDGYSKNGLVDAISEAVKKLDL